MFLCSRDSYKFSASSLLLTGSFYNLLVLRHFADVPSIRLSLSLSSLDDSFQSRVLWPSFWASFCVTDQCFFWLYPGTIVGQLLRQVTSARSSENETRGLPTPETPEGRSQSHDLYKHLPSSWVIFFFSSSDSGFLVLLFRNVLYFISWSFLKSFNNQLRALCTHHYFVWSLVSYSLWNKLSAMTLFEIMWTCSTVSAAFSCFSHLHFR